MKTPSVSVVIPARDAEETLANAVRSALGQTHSPLEVIVVDDCSTDRTADIAASFGNDRVRFAKLDVHSGAAAARNAGIEIARGEWIAFLDADDEWLPEKLEKQVLLTRPDTTLISCASNEFSPEGKDLGDTCGGLAIATGREAWKSLLAANFVSTPTVLARRSDLLALEGFDSSLKVGEDQDMWIRLALLGAVDYVFESLARVHVRRQSLSTPNISDQLGYTIAMIERHVAALGNRLTGTERRAVLGERYGRLGQATCGRGNYRNGAPIVLRSLFFGYRPMQNIWCLVVNLPALRWLRRAVRES